MVAKLLVFDGGVNGVPEVRHQALVADFGRVIHHLYRFGVPGVVGRHLLVGGLDYSATGVARGGGDNAGDFVEVRLHTPKAATRKACLGRDRRSGLGRGLCGSSLRVERRAKHQRKTEQGSRAAGDERAENSILSFHAAPVNLSATPLLQ